MKSGVKNGATKRILEALEHGPMTAAELCEQLGGYEPTSMASLLRGLVKPTPTLPQRIRIIGWTDHHFGMRDYPRAIYEIGEGVNKAKPVRSKKAQHAKAKRKYNAKVRARAKTNFVFNLGMY